MKSSLKFYDHESSQLSNCGEVLDIELSNAGLNWRGIVLEKGSSPHFYPTNVYTPYFYFAVALDKELKWNVGEDDNTTSIKAVADDIWINPPKTPFTHDISEPCHFVILAVEERVFLDSCPLNIDGLDLQFLNNYNVTDPAIKGIIDLFLLEVKAKGRNEISYIRSLVSLLSNHYVQNYSNYLDLINQKQILSKFDQGQVDRVEQYIMANIGQPISIEDLAEQLHCSKFYFLREFKKFMGLTPYQFLMSKRLEVAKDKLTATSMSIAEVGFEVGFNDQSHFSRAFKGHYGQTPGQFVKAVRS